MIQNRDALINVREDAAKTLGSYDCRILVCSGTGCIATGSEKIYEKFVEITKDAPGVVYRIDNDPVLKLTYEYLLGNLHDLY